jgi:hypothetical protein
MAGALEQEKATGRRLNQPQVRGIAGAGHGTGL